METSMPLLPKIFIVTPLLCALAACAGTHAGQSTGHSAKAASHGSAAVALTSTSVVAVPLVVTGSALVVSGAAIQHSGENIADDLAPAPMADPAPRLN